MLAIRVNTVAKQPCVAKQPSCGKMEQSHLTTVTGTVFVAFKGGWN